MRTGRVEARVFALVVLANGLSYLGIHHLGFSIMKVIFCLSSLSF